MKFELIGIAIAYFIINWENNEKFWTDKTQQ